MAGLHAPLPQTDREFLIEIYQGLGALNDKVATICTRCVTEDTRATAIERRVGNLEQWKATVTGRLIVASASSSVAGLVAGWLLKGALGGVP